MTEAQKLARIGGVLAVPSRVRIVQLLRSGALCVGTLAVRLGITQGAVSQHLRILRDAGLVAPEKRGYYVHYGLNRRTLATWKGVLDRFIETAAGGRSKSAPAADKRRKSCPRRRKAVRSRKS